MGVKFIDENPPATKGVKFIDEQKQEPTVLERAKKVGEESLTGGIFGAAAPEMMQATGQGIKRIGQAAGPYGRIPTAVGSALEAGGVAMKGLDPRVSLLALLVALAVRLPVKLLNLSMDRAWARKQRVYWALRLHQSR